MFHILLFYTEGELGTHDLSDIALRYQDMLKQHCDVLHVYTPSILLKQDKYWKDIFVDQRDFMRYQVAADTYRWNPVWASLNFLLWKPALISHLMNTHSLISDGDILFYHDVDYSKYSEYTYGIPLWHKWIEKMLKADDILLFDDNHTSLKCGIKRDVIDKYLDVTYLEKTHIWAGALAFRKSAQSLGFIDKWLSLTTELDNRSQVSLSFYPGFIWHTQEQATLAVAYYLLRSSYQIKTCFLYNSREIPPRPMVKFRHYIASLSLRPLYYWLFSPWAVFSKWLRKFAAMINK